MKKPPEDESIIEDYANGGVRWIICVFAGMFWISLAGLFFTLVAGLYLWATCGWSHALSLTSCGVK